MDTRFARGTFKKESMSIISSKLSNLLIDNFDFIADFQSAERAEQNALVGRQDKRNAYLI